MATLLVDLAAVMTVGLCLTSLLVPSGAATADVASDLTRPLLWSALTWAAAVTAQAVFSVSDLYAVPARELSQPQLTRFLEHTNLGQAQCVQVAMVLLVALLSPWVRRAKGSMALLAAEPAGPRPRSPDGARRHGVQP